MNHNDPISNSTNAIASHLYHAYADYNFDDACSETSEYLNSDYVQGQFDTFSDAAQASPTQLLGIDYTLQNVEGGSESIAIILKAYGGLLK
jgi:hypothetical protein